MLRLCDDFASDYDVKFNANKSKYIVLKPRCSHLPTTNWNLGFQIGGNEIEIVDEWPHLGHIIANRRDDDADIMSRRNCMVAQINTVLCYFGNLSAPTKLKLMNSYCTGSSFYGCDLWDLTNGCTNNICVTWRKRIRRVWVCHIIHIVTFNQCCAMLCRCLMFCVSVCYRFCWRTLTVTVILSLLYLGMQSLYSRMLSPLGRNALYWSLRYGFDISSSSVH